jgi:hypothetical protein
MDKAKKPKKSRGAIQRKKKRQQAESTERGDPLQPQKVSEESKRQHSSLDENPKVKLVKPQKKKRKVDKEEQDFEKLVDTYRSAFSSAPNADSNVSSRTESPAEKRRWYD